MAVETRTYQRHLYEKDGPVAKITFNRPGSATPTIRSSSTSCVTRSTMPRPTTTFGSS